MFVISLSFLLIVHSVLGIPRNRRTAAERMPFVMCRTAVYNYFVQKNSKFSSSFTKSLAA